MIFPLIGNERLEGSVKAFITAGRIPHAIIIEGERGLGRHTLADFLTCAALCFENDAPCGECNSCHLAKVGSHPDIEKVAPESGKKSISVNQIRELRRKAYIKAHISNRRVFIIDAAETMNEAAQNAILKVLEEPPAGVIFILIVPSRTALLETIVSRCVTLTVSAPEYELSEKYLLDKTEYNAENIQKALKQSAGNIGRALELLSGEENDSAALAAAEFLKLLPDGKAWELLNILAPFEKDRVGTERLFAALKRETVKQLRLNIKSPSKTVLYNSFYEQLCQDEELLITNINLPLLFSATVCKAIDLRNQ